MLSAVILTKNEANRIESCIQSLKFCDEILVIDDHSSDETVNFAKKLGARVVSHDLNNDFSAQRNFGLTQVKNDWVLFVDADETVPESLSVEILAAIKKSDIDGYFLPRQDYINSRPIRFGDVADIHLLRLGRRSAGKWLGKVHEVWDIKNTSTLNTPLHHHPHDTLVLFLKKINFYSTIRADELFARDEGSNSFYLFIYPIGKFVQLWLLKMGFRDGTLGLIHAMAMAFYTFMVRGKLYLLKRNIR